MSVSFLLISLLACRYQADSDSAGPDGATTAEDPGLLDFTGQACASGHPALDVRFGTSTPTVAVIEYGPTEEYGRRTVASASRLQHHLQVPGFPPGETWHWRVVATDEDGESIVGVDRRYTAPTTPPGMPEPALESRVEGDYAPGWRTTPVIGTESWVMLVDDDARATWWHMEEPGVGVTQTQPRPDGAGLTFLQVDPSREQDIGALVTRDWCGDTVATARAPWAHHDFLRRPDGRWAYLAVDIREWRGQQVVGDALVEMEADGSDPVTLWSTWDTILPDVDASCDASFYPQGCDWTHGNGVAWDEDEQVYYVSLHNLSQVVKLRRDGGTDGGATPVWSAGGPGSDFTFADADVRWTHQHGFEPIGDDEFILFDNGASVEDWSEGRRVRIDTSTWEITSTWSWGWDHEHTSYMLGDIQLLDGGGTFLAWGSEGEVTQVTEDGELAWEASFDLGAGVVGFSRHEAEVGGEVD